MIEELPLLVNDGLGHAQDGVEALLDVLDQPARLLQLPAQAAALCAGSGHTGVQALMRRRGIASWFRLTVHWPRSFAHDDVGHPRSASRRWRRAAGVGSRLQIRAWASRRPRRQPGELADTGESCARPAVRGGWSRSESQVGRGARRARPGAAGPDIPDAARADPGRLEALHVAQGDGEVVEIDLGVPR